MPVREMVSLVSQSALQLEFRLVFPLGYLSVFRLGWQWPLPWVYMCLWRLRWLYRLA
jgi:hypothetical protein